MSLNKITNTRKNHCSKNESFRVKIKENPSFPLHTSAELGKAEICEKLIEKGFDVNAKNEQGYTPLHLSSSAGYEGVVEVLLRHAATVDDTDDCGNTALHMAAYNGNKGCLQLLLNHHASINAKNKSGFTALHSSCQKRHVQCINLLIESGAKTSAKNKYKDTPLHTACREGHTKVVQTLINHSVPLDAPNKEGDTALMLSVRMISVKLVSLLLMAGASVSVCNKEGKTCMDMLVSGDDDDTIKWLLVQACKSNHKHKFSLLERLKLKKKKKKNAVVFNSLSEEEENEDEDKENEDVFNGQLTSNNHLYDDTISNHSYQNGLKVEGDNSTRPVTNHHVKGVNHGVQRKHTKEPSYNLQQNLLFDSDFNQVLLSANTDNNNNNNTACYKLFGCASNSNNKRLQNSAKRRSNIQFCNKNTYIPYSHDILTADHDPKMLLQLFERNIQQQQHGNSQRRHVDWQLKKQQKDALELFKQHQQRSLSHHNGHYDNISQYSKAPPSPDLTIQRIKRIKSFRSSRLFEMSKLLNSDNKNKRDAYIHNIDGAHEYFNEDRYNKPKNHHHKHGVPENRRAGDHVYDDGWQDFKFISTTTPTKKHNKALLSLNGDDAIIDLGNNSSDNDDWLRQRTLNSPHDFSLAKSHNSHKKNKYETEIFTDSDHFLSYVYSSRHHKRRNKQALPQCDQKKKDLKNSNYKTNKYCSNSLNIKSEIKMMRRKKKMFEKLKDMKLNTLDGDTKNNNNKNDDDEEASINIATTSTKKYNTFNANNNNPIIIAENNKTTKSNMGYKEGKDGVKHFFPVLGVAGDAVIDPLSVKGGNDNDWNNNSEKNINNYIYGGSRDCFEKNKNDNGEIDNNSENNNNENDNDGDCVDGHSNSTFGGELDDAKLVKSHINQPDVTNSVQKNKYETTCGKNNSIEKFHNNNNPITSAAHHHQKQPAHKTPPTTSTQQHTPYVLTERIADSFNMTTFSSCFGDGDIKKVKFIDEEEEDDEVNSGDDNDRCDGGFIGVNIEKVCNGMDHFNVDEGEREEDEGSSADDSSWEVLYKIDGEQKLNRGLSSNDHRMNNNNNTTEHNNKYESSKEISTKYDLEQNNIPQTPKNLTLFIRKSTSV